MAKPENEWLDINELADLWKKYKINTNDIERYFTTNKLVPSVFIPQLTLTRCNVEPDRIGLSIEPLEDIFAFGLFNICNYMNINWYQSSNGIINANIADMNVFLCNISTENNNKHNDVSIYYINAKEHIITKNDIVVEISEIKRFERKYLNENNDSSLPEKHLNLKEENNMLTVIGALLEIILREKSDVIDAIKQKQIMNQSQLIDILVKKNKPGLSKSHLEHLFPKAKKHFELN